ncbi:MAG: NAD-dependent epimerase/dehydratase family protein [Candidatus Hadarchaeum sp.]|uniref:NAD-dependent epimerase/dehydratase family protein n=1 Tax=Candidatus Hadarchaeum sp. TaxID=2883567 RepID=UPI003D0AD0EF
MTVLVTGGAGFIGSNLVEELVGLGERVIVVDDFSTGSLDNLRAVQGRVQILRTPCQRLLELELPEIKKIFHLGIPSSSPMYRDNPVLVGEAIGGFMNVFELARKNRARVVYASTSSLYRGCPTPHREDMIAEPFDFYTEARIAMERLAKVYHELYGVSSVGLRFFSVYGPHERAKGRYANNISQFLWAMREDEPPVVYGDGEQTRDFVHVSDVVRACLKAADSDLGCEVINVGTGRQTTFNRVIELLNKELGKSVKPVYVPNPVKNYVYHTLADLTKARKLLGYEPTVTVEEGIRRLVASAE